MPASNLPVFDFLTRQAALRKPKLMASRGSMVAGNHGSVGPTRQKNQQSKLKMFSLFFFSYFYLLFSTIKIDFNDVNRNKSRGCNMREAQTNFYFSKNWTNMNKGLLTVSAFYSPLYWIHLLE